MRKRQFVRSLAMVLILILGGGPVYAIPQEVPPVKFNPPVPPTSVPTVGQPFFMSFCDPPTTTPNEICGHLTHETRNPTGGNPPYHFELDRMGGFLPFGLTLHPNGLVTGTPKGRGSRDFRVCAVDLSGHFDCINYTLNVREAPTAAKKGKKQAPEPDPEDRDAVADNPKSGGMRAGMMLGLVGAAVGLGVGLAALSQISAEASCGPAPVIPNSCLGIGRNSSSCNATLQEYGRWCSCMGRTFNTSTGSCS